MKISPTGLAKKVHQSLVTGDAELNDFSESQKRAVPKNFVLLVVSYFFTKLGDAICSPKILLAWLMGFVGAPGYLVGLLVPIRESGALIPQLLIASWVKRFGIRKHIWAMGSVVQALTIILMGVAAMWLSGAAAGWSILGLLAVFSLARAFCSVTSKDVLGKVVPKTERGQLIGVSGSAAGVITIGVAVFLIFYNRDSESVALYSWLIALAGVTWLVAAAFYSQVAEPSQKEVCESGTEFFKHLSLLKTDSAFRHFVITRALLLCSALSAPFYVVLAQQAAGQSATLLGGFVLASGLAGFLSAPIWGKLADRSSKKVMLASALLTSLLAFMVLGVAWQWYAMTTNLWFYPVMFFFLSVAHEGARLGRSTYVVDLAEGDRRTDYVAVSNTCIGIILLLLGGLSALSELISVEGIILMFAAMGLVAVLFGQRLPEVESKNN